MAKTPILAKGPNTRKPMTSITMTVNGKPASAEIEGRMLLVQLLRDTLKLTGTHVGCDTSQCGACVVHIDGLAEKLHHPCGRL